MNCDQAFVVKASDVRHGLHVPNTILHFLVCKQVRRHVAWCACAGVMIHRQKKEEEEEEGGHAEYDARHADAHVGMLRHLPPVGVMLGKAIPSGRMSTKLAFLL